MLRCTYLYLSKGSTGSIRLYEATKLMLMLVNETLRDNEDPTDGRNLAERARDRIVYGMVQPILYTIRGCLVDLTR